MDRHVTVLRDRVTALRALRTAEATAEADTLEAAATAMDAGVRELAEAEVLRLRIVTEAKVVATTAAVTAASLLARVNALVAVCSSRRFGSSQRQETLDLPYLTLLCDNLKNRMFLQNFFS
jgi:hypothetical protein